MPIGFFDKYFNEDDDDEQLILLSNQSKDNKHVFDMEPAKEEEEPAVLVEKKFNKQEADDHAMRSRILQAAQQYMVCWIASNSDFLAKVICCRMMRMI